MDERPEPGTEDRHASTEEQLDLGLEDPRVMTWFAEHMPELQRSASGQRLLYQSLAFAFALGLAAHIGGYALRSSSPGEPIGLVADLLYALGYALWTGVVVALFVQVIPIPTSRHLSVDSTSKVVRGQARSGPREKGAGYHIREVTKSPLPANRLRPSMSALRGGWMRRALAHGAERS
jgi:hypothetical protein